MDDTDKVNLVTQLFAAGIAALQDVEDWQFYTLMLSDHYHLPIAGDHRTKRWWFQLRPTN